MYIGNSRTLKIILEQLSDAGTFSEQRDQLLTEQQDRYFRFILRFHDAEDNSGYESSHPLRNGYTINGQLTNSTHQIRVSLEASANSFVESLQAGDTLELVANPHRWDPAYNILEMESVEENPLSRITTRQTNDTSGTSDRTAAGNQVLRYRATAPGKTALGGRKQDRQEAHLAAESSKEPRPRITAARLLARLLGIFGCILCIGTVTLLFLYSSQTAGWSETTAKLIYYKIKKRRLFITYEYTVDGETYRKTSPNEKVRGPSGIFIWIVYKQENPTISEVSKRRSYETTIALLTVCPFLLLFFVGSRIILVQITPPPAARLIKRHPVSSGDRGRKQDTIPPRN